jgi:hypothetical protein
MESLPAVLRCANLVPPCATAAPSTAAAATGLPLPRFAWDSMLRCHLQLLHHSRNLLFPAISLRRAFFDPAASQMEKALMSHVMKRSSKLVNLQPRVCFCETSRPLFPASRSST